MRLSFTATLNKEEARRRLDRLLVPGSVEDAAVSLRIERLARAFESYASSYPLPLWGPGLAVTNEMRGLTEALFPVSQITALFDLVLRRGCRFAPLLSGSYLHSSPSWLDFLQRFRPQLRHADPAAALRELASDGEVRRDFLFALMLPHHFGASFGRYPLQAQWIASWLKESYGRLNGRIRVLDSACGSGEGSYDLAALLREAGFSGDGCAVHGSTVEQVELFAAAHAFFPHDPERELSYRARIAPLFREQDNSSLSGRNEPSTPLKKGGVGGEVPFTTSLAASPSPCPPPARGGGTCCEDLSGQHGGQGGFASPDAGSNAPIPTPALPSKGRGNCVMEFYLEDVASPGGRGSYHLILCNGLLGGPLMHEERELKAAIGSLASRLAPGGVLLAADRFHEGWKLRVPAGRLSALMQAHGLAPLELPEGVGGVKR